MSKNNVIDEANEIIPKLRDTKNNVQINRDSDPFYLLKTTLFSFFENMLRKVQTEDELESKARNAIIEKIDENEVNFSQLLSLLNAVTKEKQELADSILSIFKPTPGTGEVSPLINPRNKDDQGTDRAFKNLSPEERDNLDKLTRLLTVAAESEQSDEENEDSNN